MHITEVALNRKIIVPWTVTGSRFLEVCEGGALALLLGMLGFGILGCEKEEIACSQNST